MRKKVKSFRINYWNAIKLKKFAEFNYMTESKVLNDLIAFYLPEPEEYQVENECGELLSKLDEDFYWEDLSDVR